MPPKAGKNIFLYSLLLLVPAGGLRLLLLVPACGLRLLLLVPACGLRLLLLVATGTQFALTCACRWTQIGLNFGYWESITII